jgi:hypothetical protein
MADDKPNTPYVPPGNRALLAVVLEYRRWLAEPRIEAFGLNPQTGREYLIPVELWRSDQADEVLRTGKYGNLVVFVRDFDQPPDFVPQWPDEREGFPPSSAEPAEPVIEPSEPDATVPLPEVTPAPPPTEQQSEPVEPDEATLPEQSTLAEPVTRNRRRGRAPLEIWPDLYDYLASEVVRMGKKYPSYLKAAEEGERWLWNQNRDHPEEHKWRRLPTVDTMREKIADERSDLAEDNCD